jgi:hypothetical protein
LKHRVLSQGYLQVDEMPIAVQDKTKSGKTHRGYHWVLNCLVLLVRILVSKNHLKNYDKKSLQHRI